MSELRVLVLGGYGFFGCRLVERLCRLPHIQILVAGRSLASARAFAQATQGGTSNRLEGVALDGDAPSFEGDLRRLAPDVVINVSGPFQGRDYRVPSACIAARVHHVDLADGRDYVSGIHGLQAAALAARVTVISGASSVPALSSAAADELIRDLSIVHSIDIGISPGNRTERGLSTVRSVLSYCGKPIAGPGNSGTFGWTGTRRHSYPSPVGTRLLSPCDVPDLDLVPSRYAGNPAVRFGAGLELPFLHRGMNILAWMARKGLVADWSRHAVLLKRAADLFRNFGSDAGAMHVRVQGRDGSGSNVTRTWELVATHGDGPFVPTLPAAALVRQFQSGVLRPGADPCIGQLSLADFKRETNGLAIRMEVEL